MRSAPLAMVELAEKLCSSLDRFDAIFCSDMLDLPSWLGLALSKRRLREKLIYQTQLVPIVTYFHENQWTYPQSPDARTDHHYGYTNLMTALASDACWFNSEFHRESFLGASESFVGRMPDSRTAHDFERLRTNSDVLPPGFPEFCVPESCAPEFRDEHNTNGTDVNPLRIGWVSRWEFDKRPDRLVEILHRLRRQGVVFQLILLGPRNSQMQTSGDDSLNRIRDEFHEAILHDGYAESRKEYEQWLSQMDVVVSTADHEFFGIAICEAVWAGAIPILPNRLSYIELFPALFRYDGLDDAVSMIQSFCEPSIRAKASVSARESIEHLTQPQSIERIDDAMERLVSQRKS